MGPDHCDLETDTQFSTFPTTPENSFIVVIFSCQTWVVLHTGPRVRPGPCMAAARGAGHGAAGHEVDAGANGDAVLLRHSRESLGRQ